jgi:hypothetical protein
MKAGAVAEAPGRLSKASKLARRDVGAVGASGSACVILDGKAEREAVLEVLFTIFFLN